MINTTNGKMSIILGMDSLQKNENKFREISTFMIKYGKEIVVEVGLSRSGECSTLIAGIPYWCV